MSTPNPKVEADIEFIVKNLIGAKGSRQRRLDRGFKLRNRLAKNLENGVPDDGYRAEWIRESVGTMMNSLEGIALKFNKEHPDDMCSVADFMDILLSTIANLKKAASGS